MRAKWEESFLMVREIFARLEAAPGVVQPSGMKRLLTALVLISALWGQSAEEAIRAVLARQAADWNRGDVRAFMRGYDDSEATVFIGARVARGYRRVLENYLERYATKPQMGELTFSNIEVRPLGVDYALVIGNFHLARVEDAGGDSEGIFSLTFQRKPGGWKIIADHTSDLK